MQLLLNGGSFNKNQEKTKENSCKL